MNAKLEFDLEDVDDVMAHLRCVKSEDMALALFKIQGLTKEKFGYELSTLQIQNKINDVLKEYDIELDDLIR